MTLQLAEKRILLFIAQLFIISDVTWGDVFVLAACVAAAKFREWVQVGMGIISVIESIRSSLIYGGYLLMLLSYLIEVTTFVCTNRIDLVSERTSLGSSVIIAKGFLNLSNLLMLLK